MEFLKAFTLKHSAFSFWGCKGAHITIKTLPSREWPHWWHLFPYLYLPSTPPGTPSFRSWQAASMAGWLAG